MNLGDFTIKDMSEEAKRAFGKVIERASRDQRKEVRRFKQNGRKKPARKTK